MSLNIPNSNPQPPNELVEHLDQDDCVLFVGDALDVDGSPSARLASALEVEI